jgi:hypothetical protein
VLPGIEQLLSLTSRGSASSAESGAAGGPQAPLHTRPMLPLCQPALQRGCQAAQHVGAAAAAAAPCDAARGVGGSGAAGPLSLLLRDEGFVSRLLAALPGVEPCSPAVVAAVRELRDAHAHGQQHQHGRQHAQQQ